MSDPTTSNRTYAIPVHGSDVDAWDVPLNSNFSLMDTNLGATVAVSVGSSPITLAANQVQYGLIQFSGTLTANVTVTWPSVAGWWSVENLASGNFVIKLTCGGGNVICAPPGEVVDIAADGTNMKYRNLGRVGSYLDLAATAIPAWMSNCTVPPYLLCDGTTFSSGTYPALNRFLGGTTLPDCRGRLAAYMNGATSRITTGGSGIDGSTLFASGGAQNETLIQGNLPSVDLSAGSLTGVTASQVVTNITSSNFGTITKLQQGGGNDAFDSINIGGNRSTVNVTIGGSVPLGGSGTPLTTMPPTVMGGIRLIRAA